MKSIYSLFVRGYQVNPTETNRKGLTELSEINLARPFLLVLCKLFVVFKVFSTYEGVKFSVSMGKNLL